MRVPFPHVERPVLVPRPALVVSVGEVGPGGLLIWTLMITNAEREHWPGDVMIPGWQELGLLIPSKVRAAKINALETGNARAIGKLDTSTWEKVLYEVGRNLGV